MVGYGKFHLHFATYLKKSILGLIKNNVIKILPHHNFHIIIILQASSKNVSNLVSALLLRQKEFSIASLVIAKNPKNP